MSTTSVTKIKETPEIELPKSLDVYFEEWLKFFESHRSVKYRYLWLELKEILNSENYVPQEWSKRPKDEIILGDVYEQHIAKINYHRTVHQWTAMFIPGFQGKVIAKHGHKIKCSDGIERNQEEFYLLPYGEYQFCPKGKTHELRNNAQSILVISLKIWQDVDPRTQSKAARIRTEKALNALMLAEEERTLLSDDERELVNSLQIVLASSGHKIPQSFNLQTNLADEKIVNFFQRQFKVEVEIKRRKGYKTIKIVQ